MALEGGKTVGKLVLDMRRTDPLKDDNDGEGKEGKEGKGKKKRRTT